MKFSFATLPDYPLADSIEMIKTADELGFYACYSVDETWHKDPYVLFAAATDKTTNIRFGPNVAPIGLREPTLVCQTIATLDELTGGRMDLVVSIGNFGLLAQYKKDWTKIKSFSRVREAHQVMRTFMDTGAITRDGEFYEYAGLFSFARPVQERLPIFLGAMRGPKSFELAGEISDGCHHALSYSKEAYEYLVKHMTIGAEKAGRNVQDLDIGAWCAFAVGPDSAQAKLAGGALVVFYVTAMPNEQLERHGIDPKDMAPIIDAMVAGDIPGAIKLLPPEVADTLSISGTPEECVEKIRVIADTGVNHMILCVTDAFLVKAFTGMDADVPDVHGQLKIIHDEIMPAFN
jgi:alkanesulfonate monooxygenase SsuD/methylene tetrahydromethanopterin reductase-like flavin-dependent oxidoreductase (luciferase family)